MGYQDPGWSGVTPYKQRLLSEIAAVQFQTVHEVLQDHKDCEPTILAVDCAAGPGCHPKCKLAKTQVGGRAGKNCCPYGSKCPEERVSSAFILAEALRRVPAWSNLVLCEKNPKTEELLRANMAAWTRSVDDGRHVESRAWSCTDVLAALRSDGAMEYTRPVYGLVYADFNGYADLRRSLPGILTFLRRRNVEHVDLLVNWACTSQKRGLDVLSGYWLDEQIASILAVKRYAACRRILANDPQNFVMVFFTNWREHPVLRMPEMVDPCSAAGARQLLRDGVNLTGVLAHDREDTATVKRKIRARKGRRVTAEEVAKCYGVGVSTVTRAWKKIPSRAAKDAALFADLKVVESLL